MPSKDPLFAPMVLDSVFLFEISFFNFPFFIVPFPFSYFFQYFNLFLSLYKASRNLYRRPTTEPAANYGPDFILYHSIQELVINSVDRKEVSSGHSSVRPFGFVSAVLVMFCGNCEWLSVADRGLMTVPQFSTALQRMRDYSRQSTV